MIYGKNTGRPRMMVLLHSSIMSKKYVLSIALEAVDWQNKIMINKNLCKNIANFKKEPGRHIGIHGRITLVRSLLEK